MDISVIIWEILQSRAHHMNKHTSEPWQELRNFRFCFRMMVVLLLYLPTIFPLTHVSPMFHFYTL